jgi:hypothetical protein
MRLTEDGVMKLSVGSFLLSEIMAGPIRYYSFNHGLPFLVYLPKAEMTLLALIFALTGRLRSIEFFIIGAIFLIYGFIASYQLLTPPQIWFAAWTMVPLLFSVIAARYVLTAFDDYRNMFAGLYAITVLGVLLNYFHGFPWTYGSFSVAGHSLQSARSWATGGFVRLGGFGRASYNAASQSLILAIFITARLRSRPLEVFIWLLTGVVIVLTTAKGVLLAYVFIVGYGLSRFVVRSLKPLAAWTTESLFSIAICVIAVVMVLLPWLAASRSINIDPHTTLGVLLFQSFSTRLTQTWPEALQLLTSSTAALFGNGLGSISAGQAFVLDSNPNTADNLFVFLDVQYGMILTLVALAGFVLKIVMTNARRDSSGMGRVIVSLGLLLLIYGCLSNELEDGFLATSVGFCLAYRRRWAIPEPFEAGYGDEVLEAT